MLVTSHPDTWYAIINIFAASKKALSLWRKAEERLKEDNISFEAHFTGDEGNAMTLTRAACEEGARKFIAVGGDGTVHDVLGGIMSFVESPDHKTQVCISDFTLAVIPVGSGNDWIKTAGIPQNVVKAASLFRNGATSKQDIVKVSLLDPRYLPVEEVLRVSYMANVGGIGIDARVCERVNKAKERGRRGKKLYVSALLHNIIHRVPANAHVISDGKQIFSGAFLSMAFGIGKYSGGGMRQTPDATFDDGLLDMTIIPDLPVLKIAKEAHKLFNGRFVSVRELVTSKSKTITIIPFDESIPCQYLSGEPVEVDGEVVGNSPVRFDVLEDQMNILTSPDSNL